MSPPSFPASARRWTARRITEAFGEKAIAPFVKKTHYQTVKLVEN